MLACARIGAVHSVVFGGFAPRELAVRIDDAQPKVILVGLLRHRADPRRGVQADHRPGPRARRPPAGRRGGQAAPAGRGGPARAARRRLGRGDEGRAHRPRRSASRSRPPTRSTCSTRPARPASRRASSATTAGTRWRWRGPCRNIYDVHAGQVWWTASDVGWVVGHSYIVYAPLITGATTVLYEGKPVGTPDAGAFWRVVAEHGVEALFTAPTAIRAIKKEDPDGEPAGRPRPEPAAHAVPGRRAARPGDLPLGHRAARRPGRRPLVADRDRLADRGQPARARPDADQGRLADGAGARLRRRGPRRAGRAGAGRARRARSASGCRCHRAR